MGQRLFLVGANQFGEDMGVAWDDVVFFNCQPVQPVA